MLLEQSKVNLYQIYKSYQKNKNIVQNLNKYKNLFQNNKVWILKPIYGNEGKDIVICKTYEDFIQLIIKKIKNKNLIQKWKKLNYAIIQKCEIILNLHIK